MREIILLTGLTSFLMYSCQEHQRLSHNLPLTADQQLLDSISKETDSIYSRHYLAGRFTTTEYMVNSKDSTITQVIKDTAGVTRQVVIVKNKQRIYSAQYYANGQLKASYAFDKYGQYHGASEEYWENGLVKETGYYTSGLRYGDWKKYDSTGRYEGLVYYNNEGLPQVRNDLIIW